MAGYIGANTSSVTNNQNAAERRKKFTFTANTTVLSGLNFAPEKIHIFHNGIRLVRTTDYTEAADGKSVTLVNAAQAGDEVVAVTFAQDPASNAGYTDADVDAHLLTAGVTLDATNDKVGIGNTTPVGKLTISNAAGTNAPTSVTAANTYLQLGNDDYGPSNNGKFMIGFGYTDNPPNTNSPAYIGFEETNTSGDTKGDLTFYTRSVTTDTAPTVRMRINEDGHITKPSQPAFRAWKSGSSYNLNANDTFIFENTIYNIGSHYNTSTGRFTAPIDGIYHFNFYTIQLGSVNNGQIKVYINGARIKGGDVHFSPNSGNYWDYVAWNGDLQLSASDYVHVVSPQAEMYHGNNWAHFTGHLVG